jgi:NAD(P)-dependent dehydrogenase (short-subunit alcohol dehydrogenase family)
MTAKLQNKVALVVGSGSVRPGWSNGKATAVHFAREGARVVCFDVSRDAAEETAGIIKQEGGDAIAVCGDATQSSDLSKAVDACRQTFGKIDILQNNVGVVVNGGVVDLAEEDWDRVFAVNLKSSYLSMKLVIPHMIERGGGSIVNVSSISSIRFLGAPYASYYSSKAALNHLTRVTAAEFASRQVRVNAVLPGMMDTPMAALSAVENHGVSPDKIDEAWARKAERIPMGWMGDAWDVAKASAFLASDDARFITGVSLVVDGGLTLRS